ncbi:hypothetical protein [Pseudonocardia sp.]|uniref:hypothetical protein n=1 Tax=Pseudonocardia sp. TaxID=60912 RepID=UPI003D11DFE7
MSHPIPAVVDALLAAVKATAAFKGVQVDDGPPTRGRSAPDAIGIGFDIQDLTPATAAVAPGFGNRRNESYALTCSIDSFTGDAEDLAGRRSRAYALLDAMHALLAADPQLGDTCSWARITRHAYRPYQAETGAGVLIEFGVQVDATRFQGE